MKTKSTKKPVFNQDLQSKLLKTFRKFTQPERIKAESELVALIRRAGFKSVAVKSAAEGI